MVGMSEGISARARVAITSFSLLCVSLFLTAYSSKHPALVSFGSVLISEIVTPFQSFSEFVSQSGSSIWERYLYLVGVSEENEDLRVRLRKVEGELALLSEFRTENERLRSMLNFVSETELQGVVGRVIGSDPSGWVKGVMIDKGSSSGVAVGMAAVVARGVVGQVVATSLSSSRILLIADHASGVDAIVQGSRVRGVVEGSGSQLCELRYVTRDYQVKTGELVLSSGMDGVYPKGLMIGTVSAVQAGGATLFQTVEVKPAVDFSRLEEVLIVTSKPDATAEAGEPLSSVVKRLRQKEE
jgi:rod shape-determining protein MreC